MMDYNVLHAESLQYIHEKLIEDNVVNYLGTKVFYSSFIERPKYLLIGINPGSDNFESFYQENGFKLIPFEEMSDGLHHYIYGGNKLAETMDYIFDKSRHYDDFINYTMKINCFFQGTYNSKILSTLFTKIDKIVRDRYSLPFFKLQSEIILNLINQIKPNYIICEGKTAYTYMLDFLKSGNIKTSIKASANDRLKEIVIQLPDAINIVGFPRIINGSIDPNFIDKAIEWMKIH